MEQFMYFMPTKLYVGENCVIKNQEVLKQFGKKAMLVTGRTSAKKNGAEADVRKALEAVGIDYIIFDEIMENPDTETIIKGGAIGREAGVDFVIGIGGGSPMDASKAIGVLIYHKTATEETLYYDVTAKSIPVIAIPTTAGTGSETTPYSIVTVHADKTKRSIAPKIFATVSFLDVRYMESLSTKILNDTAIDALTHLIESYLCRNSNFFSQQLVEMGLRIFVECMEELKTETTTTETKEKLLLASCVAGFAIAQTGTSLPHSLGYFLTYEKGVAHGKANGILLKAYLELFPKTDESVAHLLKLLRMETLQDLQQFLEDVLHITETFTEEDVLDYTKRAFTTPEKMRTFPYGEEGATEEEVRRLYAKSFGVE